MRKLVASAGGITSNSICQAGFLHMLRATLGLPQNVASQSFRAKVGKLVAMTSAIPNASISDFSGGIF